MVRNKKPVTHIRFLLYCLQCLSPRHCNLIDSSPLFTYVTNSTLFLLLLLFVCVCVLFGVTSHCYLFLCLSFVLCCLFFCLFLCLCVPLCCVSFACCWLLVHISTSNIQYHLNACALYVNIYSFVCVTHSSEK